MSSAPAARAATLVLVSVVNRPFLVVSALVVVGVAIPSAQAQTVLLRGGATLRTQVAPGAKVAVPVVIDLSGSAGTNVSSLTMGMSWGTSRLTFDSLRAGTFGSLTSNTGGAASGSVVMSAFSAAGTTTTVTMATAYFTASASTGGTRVAFTPTVAGNDVGTDLLPIFRVQALDVCVAASGLWGDTNGDGNVNIIDAQQIARFSVGLAVANLNAVTTQGDVTADGNVNIIDAQQIARFSVSLTAAARVNTSLSVQPAVATLTLNQTTASANIGASVQLSASPVDAGSSSISGCVPVAWTTSAAAIATVDSTGRVVGMAPGTATITATAGAKTALATITVGAVAGPAAAMQVVAGDQQWSYTGLQVPVSPKVLVKDASNVPVPNAPVTFTASGGTLNNGDPVIVNTDANGLATSASWIAPASGSTVTMTASVGGSVPNATVTVNVAGAALGQTMCVYDVWGNRCWGNGTRGQLGNGTNTSSLTPVNVSVGTTNLRLAPTTAFGDHFCGLDPVGAAYCWGGNWAGQLGDGTRTDRNVPTSVSGGLAFQSLATGVQHTCGVTTAGDVYCWGISTSGQVGDSTVGTSRTAPTKAKTPAGVAFTQVAAGYNFTCATTAAGDVYCWGLNTTGQLGDGTTSTLPRSYPLMIAGTTKLTSLAGGVNSICGLTAAGAAYCWGANSVGQLGNTPSLSSAAPIAVQGGMTFSRVSMGVNRACGERQQASEFTVWCWGLNSGSLGDGTTFDRAAPTLLPGTLSTLVHGGAGSGTACGLGVGGSQVFCWGTNSAGQVGDGTNTARFSPTVVARAGASPGAVAAMQPLAIGMVPQSAAIGTAVALPPSVQVLDGLGFKVAGVTVTWTVQGGGGSVGSPTSVTDANGIAASGGWTLGSTVGQQKMQASVSGVVVNNAPAPPLLTTFIAYGTNTPASAVKISGDSMYSALGLNGGVAGVPLVVKVLDAANNPIANVSVAFTLGANSGTFSGGATTLGAVSDANGLAVFSGGGYWSPNTTAGSQSTVTATITGLATPLVFTHFRVSGNFGGVSCELTAAAAAMCAGLNTFGTVGDGTTSNRSTFVPISGGLAFTSLADGVAMTKCGLVGVTAYCWGLNSMGQIGDGTLTDRSVPTAVSGGLAFSRLASQGSTTCGLTTSSQVYCWGWSGDGGWGEGEAARGRIRLVPTLVNTGGLSFTKITVTDNGMCGLTAAGTIHCRARGLNGDGTSAISTTFTQWSGGPWMDLSAGNTIACALNTAGLAYCLGSGQVGGLGTGSVNGVQASVIVPTQTLGGVSYSSITVGNFRACARRSNGELYCWGINNGTGVFGQVDRPTMIPGFLVSSVRFMTFRNACAKMANGMLYCWGANNSITNLNVVGDGTTIDRLSPVPIPNWPDGPAAGTAVGMSAGVASYTQVVSTIATPAPNVKLVDRLGAPVVGVTVTFTALAGSGVVAGGSVVTDAAGVATVGSWTLPATVGTSRLDVTAPGVPPVSFPATVQTAPTSITISSGNNQYVPDFYGNTQPFSVTVLDANGAPISGMGVTLAVTAGNGTVGGSSSAITATNSSGVATASTWNPPTAIGTAYTMTASVPGLAPVTFTSRRLADRLNGASNAVQSVCRLNNAGAAFCWGGNVQGQLGDGTNASRTVPTLVSGGLTFASLARGHYGLHQCGLTAGGQAYCWGNNDAGQLGNNSQINSNVPVAVTGGLTFASLGVANFSTCGLTTGGAMYCWGWGAYSFRGDGEIYTIRTVPTLVNTGGRTFTSIAVGGRALCALDAAGQAFCWGENFSGQMGDGTNTSATTPQSTSTSLRFSQLTAGYDATCGITTTNAVACWGSNSQGAVGNGSTSAQTSPVVLTGLNGMLEVRAGEQHACARDNASVYCWGANGSGQVGDGIQTTPRRSPVRAISGIAPVSLSAMGRFLSCASSSNQLYCWGGSNGGVGDGTFSNRFVPTAVQWPETLASDPATLSTTLPLSLSGAAGTPQNITVQLKNAFGAVTPNIAVTFVVTSGGGAVSVATVNTDASGNASTAWSLAGAIGTVGTMEARVPNVPSLVFTGTIAGAAGAITITGGDNQYLPDFFGSGTALSVTVLDGSNAPSVGTTVTWTVAAGNGTLTTTATNTNAAGVATLTGWVPPSAIGTNYTLQASVPGPAPVTFTARRMAWSSNGVNNPANSMCRLNSSGAPYCWGGNAQGQVGDGTTTARTTPTAVSGGLTFASLAKGALGFHNCGLTSTGQAYCWGDNEAGQLGNNVQANSSVPVPVSGGLTFASIGTGALSTCGLTSAGVMYCWGWGAYSFRGDGEIYTIRSVPTAVNTGGRTFVSFAVGFRQVCALDAAGQAFCWGENYGGQLGNGNTTYSTAPVATSTALRFSSLASGYEHVCGLTTDNTVACWGSNYNGVVGNGTTTNQTTPLVVSSIAGALDVRAGEVHNCARTSASVYCWGANYSGQVGDGTTAGPRSTPLVVFSGVAPTALLSFSRSVSCATTSTQMYCWGWSPGGIGDGTFSGRNAPTTVQWPEASPSNPGSLAAVTPQSISTSAASPLTVTVQLKNSAGTVMSGVAVNFVVTSGGGTVSVATANTDASGNATTAWTLAGAVGSVGTMEARVAGVPSLNFTGTISAPAGSITITGGNNQYLPDFFTFANGLAVTVRDGSNNPMVGVTVTWSLTAGNGTISTTAINTGAGGIATLNGWSVPMVIGSTYTLQASVNGPAPVNFAARVLAWSNNGANNPGSAMCRLNSAAAAYCWGGNAQGQVGDGSNTIRTAPTAVSGGLTFASLATGAFGLHNCGLTSSGVAYCWGNNDAGQLGNNAQTNSNVPVAVSGGLTFSTLATGPYSTCGISTAGVMYCWGWGSYSHRGDGELYTIRTTPTLVNIGGRTFVSFAVGFRAVCALDAAGQAFCWGDNFGGQLGSGNTTASTTPVSTLTSLRFTSLSIGFDHTCGLTTGNTVACWGYGGNGAVGNGTTTNQTSPLVLAGIAGAIDVRAGESHNCARNSTSLYCWGANGSGQIGDGTNAGPRTSPLLVASALTPTSLLSFGKFSSCATSSTQMYCWGGSPAGIGDGSGASRNVATAVRWPDALPSNPAMIFANTPTTFTAVAGAPQTVTVQVRNAQGTILSGVTVNFVVTAGGGTVTVASGTTDTGGNISTSWTLAGASGTIGKLEARVSGLPSLVITGTIP